MKNNIIKDALVLFAITVCAGLLLGATYTMTKEPIAEQQIKIRDAALNSVLGNASFDQMKEDLSTQPIIQEIYQANRDSEIVGYAFKLSTKEGYGGTMEIIAGINVDGTVSGVDIIKHSETPGLGANADTEGFKDQFKGKPTKDITVVKDGADTDTEIDSLSGATITSRAVANAVNAASEYFNNNLSKGAQ